MSRGLIRQLEFRDKTNPKEEIKTFLFRRTCVCLRMDGREEWDLNVNKLMQYSGKEKDFEIRHIWVEDPLLLLTVI